MRPHHREPVAQALAVALLGDAAHEIVGRDKARIDVFAAFFEYFDAPVVVGAEVVVHERRSDGKARDEGLVHHEHAAQKLAPVEVFGQLAGAEFAHGTDGPALRIHEHRFAIEHVGLGHDEGRHFFQNIGRVDMVAAVEAPHEIAGGDAHALVHGVVQPFVRLRYPAHIGHRFGKILYDLQRVVFGSAVYENVFDVRVGLAAHTFHGARQVGSAVVDDGDDGENGWGSRRWTVDGGWHGGGNWRQFAPILS